MVLLHFCGKAREGLNIEHIGELLKGIIHARYEQFQFSYFSFERLNSSGGFNVAELLPLPIFKHNTELALIEGDKLHQLQIKLSFVGQSLETLLNRLFTFRVDTQLFLG